MKVAPPDEYQNVAPIIMVDWLEAITSAVTTILRDNAAEPHAVIEELWPFDVTCFLRAQQLLGGIQTDSNRGPECPRSLDMTLGTRSPI
jgi:hypothetical protein